MTKAEFVYMIIHNEAGGDVSTDELSELHPLQLEKVLSQAYEKALNMCYELSVKSKDSFFLDAFAKRIQGLVPIKSDERWFLTLPETLVNLPQWSAIRSFHPACDPSASYSPVSPGGHLAAYRTLETRHFTRKRYYSFLDANTVEILDAKDEDFPLEMIGVVSFESLDDDDVFVMPSGKGIDFVAMVMQIIRNPKEENEVNDGS